MIRIRLHHRAGPHGNLARYRVDLDDSQYSGEPRIRRASKSFFDWDYDQLDERNPQAIQKSSLEISLFIQDHADLALLNDILDADENRFRLHLYINDEHKW